MPTDSRVASATSLVLALSGLLACGGGAGGTGTHYGAVIVVSPGSPNYFASAAFSEKPRLLSAGEFTSLEFGIGEPDGCTKKTVGACRVFRCPKGIAATPRQGTEPDVGAITIDWPGGSGASGPDALPAVTFGPESYDLFFWGTETLAPRFSFSAAGGTIPAFPATDVDVPQLFEVTQLDGASIEIDPRVPRGVDLPVTWTGGTGDAVFDLQQRPLGTDNDLLAVCRVATSAGHFTFPSGVLGEFLPGDVQLRASAVSTKQVAAGDYATTLAIAVPRTLRFRVTIE